MWPPLLLLFLTGCSVPVRPFYQPQGPDSTPHSGHLRSENTQSANTPSASIPPGGLARFMRDVENVTIRRRADWRAWAAQQLQTGDLVFTRGNHYVLLGLVNFTDLATRACDAEFSHVGIVAVEDEVPYVYDVNQKGVTRKPFAQYITQPGYERVTVRRLQPSHWHLLPTVLEFIEQQRQAQVPFDHAFAEGPEALYCTELICLAFAEAGSPICPLTPVADLPGWNELAPWLVDAGQWATGLTPQSRLYPIGNENYGLIGSPYLETELPPTEVSEGPPRKTHAALPRKPADTTPRKAAAGPPR